MFSRWSSGVTMSSSSPTLIRSRASGLKGRSSRMIKDTSVPGKPKLGHFDTGEPRLGRDANLQQISRDSVEWRNLHVDIMRRLIVVKPE